MRVGFTFEGATLDGAPVPAKTEAVPTESGSRSATRTDMSTIGEHRYVIRYRTTRQIGRFKDYDELYWNATGNGWMFPIDVAEARIRLPAAGPVRPARRLHRPQGATGSNAEVVEEKPGDDHLPDHPAARPVRRADRRRRLPQGRGRRSEAERSRLVGSPITGRRWSASSACSACASSITSPGSAPGATRAPGPSCRCSRRPTACRLPACATSTKMNADNRAFAAALVDMGVRGHIKLVEEEGGWFSRDKTRLERLPSDTSRFRRRRKRRCDALCPARRIDHDGAEEPRRNFLLRRTAWREVLKNAV